MSLPVSRLVNVNINLTPVAAAPRSFGILMIAGDSDIINGLQRYKTYSTIDDVTADFGTTTPEYYAAALYFGQTPKPKTLMIGRWLRTATAGLNLGGILTTVEQTLATWTSVTNGGVVISIDGTVKTLTGLNFSAQTNLNGVATVITTALSGAGTVTWTGSYFKVVSATTGILSSVSYATAGTGTDISGMLKLTSALSQGLVAGYASETPVQCATALQTLSTAWFGLQFAASTMPTDDQSIAVSDYIEALDVKRIYGVSSTDTNILSSSSTTDIAYRMAAAKYLQSCCQYSANKYAIASLFGRAFSVDFNANRSTITLMYKQEPSVVPETLTSDQASTLQTKRCNVFVNYNNDTAIIQYGVMSGPAYFDEIHGLDWLQNQIQNNVYNALYTSSTKIPQTDAGSNVLVNAINKACDAGVNNGLVAPGVWNADGFGQLSTGQYLKTGYYVYAQPMALQSQSDRETRVAPPIQVAVKLAGAIQTVDITLNVNR